MECYRLFEDMYISEILLCNKSPNTSDLEKEAYIMSYNSVGHLGGSLGWPNSHV